jgi:dihydroorotate dehydrogenase (fumarate)
MLCSALLKQGIHHIAYLEGELGRWMEKHGFESVTEMQGLMSQKRVADPTAFERAHYIRSLRSVQLTRFGGILQPWHIGIAGDED